MSERIDGPDANGMYSRVVDGVVVETWHGTAGLNAGSVAPVSNTTTIDRSGRIIPAGTAPPTDDPVGIAAPATTTSAPPTTESGSEWAAPRGGSSGTDTRGGGGGYRPSTGADSGGYSGLRPGGFSGGAGYQDDPFSNLPAYRDGRTHPAAGGAPLVPGGIFAQSDEGFDDRRQMTSDSGASAGPFGVNAARQNPWQAEKAIAGADRPWLGDTGPNLNPRYEALRAKGNAIESKVRGMASNIRYGGGGQDTSSSATTSTAQYDRQGKRMDRAYDRYNEELYDPDPMPVKGWAKRQGFKPGTIDAALGDPTLLLTSALPGYESRDSPYSEGIESLPMTDLALIAGGTQNKRGLTSRTPVVKVPGILKKQGVKPVKPENTRTLDSSKVANDIATMYKSLGQPGGDTSWMDQEQLLGNLATAKRGSILRQNLRTQFEDDPNAAMQSIASYIRSAMSAGPDTDYSRALIEDVDRQVTNQGADLLRRKPKRADRIIQPLARSYLT